MIRRSIVEQYDNFNESLVKRGPLVQALLGFYRLRREADQPSVRILYDRKDRQCAMEIEKLGKNGNTTIIIPLDEQGNCRRDHLIVINAVNSPNVEKVASLYYLRKDGRAKLVNSTLYLRGNRKYSLYPLKNNHHSQKHQLKKRVEDQQNLLNYSARAYAIFAEHTTNFSTPIVANTFPFTCQGTRYIHTQNLLRSIKALSTRVVR